jgi:hypothetical protein
MLYSEGHHRGSCNYPSTTISRRDNQNQNQSEAGKVAEVLGGWVEGGWGGEVGRKTS